MEVTREPRLVEASERHLIRGRVRVETRHVRSDRDNVRELGRGDTLDSGLVARGLRPQGEPGTWGEMLVGEINPVAD